METNRPQEQGACLTHASRQGSSGSGIASCSALENRVGGGMAQKPDRSSCPRMPMHLSRGQNLPADSDRSRVVADCLCRIDDQEEQSGSEEGGH